MRAKRHTSGWLALPAAGMALILAGCGAGASPAPTPIVTEAPPTATPTQEVSLVVNLTPLPTPKTVRRRPASTATPTLPRKAPYILLAPSFGPPQSRSIRLIGGNLPKRVPVDVLWAPKGTTSAVDTVIYTGPRGNINVPYSVPSAPPGTYGVLAKINGVPIALTHYRVVTYAALHVAQETGPNGEQVMIRGDRFIGSLKLSLVAYPVLVKHKPYILGVVRTSPSGMFSFRGGKKLPPGQYVLRAYSMSSLAAQMAETVFEVNP